MYFVFIKQCYQQERNLTWLTPILSFYRLQSSFSIMSNLDEKECFTVEWNISNFSLVSSAGKYPVRSPIFKTENDNGIVTWWRLLAYYSTSSVEFRVTIFKGGEANNRHEISLLSTNEDVKVPLSYLSSDSMIYGYSIENDDIFRRKRNCLLPLDTLTVCCKIWQRMIKPERCIFHTALHRVNMIWTIEEFSSDSPLQRTVQQQDTLQVILFHYKKPDNSKVRVELQPHVGGYAYFVNCELSTQSNFALCFSSRTHYPCTSWLWDMESFEFGYSGTFCVELKSLVAVDTEHQLMSTKHPLPISSSVTPESSATPRHSSTLREDLLLLYREILHSDATLKTEEKSFPVHKSILSARSKVFRAMFESDSTSEGLSGIVNIEDIDSETLERMLVFLYADTFEDMQWEDALALYYAADKYAIHSLKLRCAGILKAGVTVTNVCQLLLFADHHSDEQLVKVVVEFIRDHDEVISSAEWVELEDSNPKLTTKVMRELYVMQRGSKTNTKSPQGSD